MKNKRLQERKDELKSLALQGRNYRKNFGCGWTPYTDEARYKHIAYCMARGKEYKQIEQKVSDEKFISPYTWERIYEDIAYLKEGFNEDVRVSA
jgi:hypothetical protein